MGILRFLMALAVVATHSADLIPFHTVPGMKAVQTFYIISGFYMALILEDKYLQRPHSFRIFITNRLLRIYPLYFIVLILSLFYYSLVPPTEYKSNPLSMLVNMFEQKDRVMPISIILTTLLIIGQDIIIFAWWGTSIGQMLLFPQGWTLSLELMFYLLAPFFVRQKTAPLIHVLGASIGLRIFLYTQGLKYDPWTHRFFPTELALFIGGILSFRLYQQIRNKHIPSWGNAMIFMMILGMIFLFPVLGPAVSSVKTMFYFIALGIGLPFIFYLTRNNKFDRWIGDFSYPIYISHILIRTICIDHGITKSDPLYGWKVAAGSFALSLLLLYLVIYPIDKIRENRILDHKL